MFAQPAFSIDDNWTSKKLFLNESPIPPALKNSVSRINGRVAAECVRSYVPLAKRVRSCIESHSAGKQMAHRTTDEKRPSMYNAISFLAPCRGMARLRVGGPASLAGDSRQSLQGQLAVSCHGKSPLCSSFINRVPSPLPPSPAHQ